jgi:membrane protease YdiL (CAAX protease family)
MVAINEPAAPDEPGKSGDLPLTCRQRVGLTGAIVALALTMNPVNRQVRFWVRDQLLEGRLPPWLEKTTVMVTFATLFWGLLGWLLIGRKGLGLRAPERPREAWLMSVVVGLVLMALLVPALALSHVLGWQLRLDPLGNVADLVSNFEEELVGRGAILGLLSLALGRKLRWLAAIIAGALFCQGHWHYPAPLIVLVFIAGTAFSLLTIRYRSIWPAVISHDIVDVIGDIFLKS